MLPSLPAGQRDVPAQHAAVCRAATGEEVRGGQVTTRRGGGEPRGWRAIALTDEATGEGIVPLRPMTVGDLLDEPFVLLRAHARDLLLFSAIAVVPAQLIGAYLQRGLLGQLGLDRMLSDPETFSLTIASDPGVTVAGWIVTALNTLVLLPITVALVSRLAVSAAVGDRPTTAQLVRATLGRLPTLGVTWVLGLGVIAAPLVVGFALAAAGGGLALVGAGVVILALPVTVVGFALLAAAPTIAVVEDAGPLASLRRSVTLLRPRFWAVAGALSLSLLVASLVQTALAGIPRTMAFFAEITGGWLLLAGGATIAGLVVTPYTAIVAALIYLDARVRREALDVRIQADRRNGGTWDVGRGTPPGRGSTLAQGTPEGARAPQGAGAPHEAGAPSGVT
jgi:hypothetical protein